MGRNRRLAVFDLSVCQHMYISANMANLQTCSRCKSEVDMPYFGLNRNTQPYYTCDTCRHTRPIITQPDSVNTLPNALNLIATPTKHNSRPPPQIYPTKTKRIINNSSTPGDSILNTSQHQSKQTVKHIFPCPARPSIFN